MRRGLPLLTTSVLALGGLSPAAAESFRGSDPRGDVRTIGVGVPVRSADTPRHPRRALGDITSFRVVHTNSTVRVLLKVLDLRRTQGPHELAVDVRAPHVAEPVAPVGPGEVPPPPPPPYDDYTAYVETGPGGDGVPSAHPWAGSRVQVYRNATEPVPCTAVRRVDYRANTVLLVVPRQCLGNPTWIRASGSVTTDAHDHVRVFWDVTRFSPRLSPVPDPVP